MIGLQYWAEITERYSNWFERMLQYGFVENIDYIGCKFFTKNCQELQDHQLTIEMAKEISMIQRKEASKLSKELGVKMGTTPEPRFGQVNTYHIDILKSLNLAERSDKNESWR